MGMKLGFATSDRSLGESFYPADGLLSVGEERERAREWIG